jgi:formylglycine-generating enzyme required for sulfatase activity
MAMLAGQEAIRRDTAPAGGTAYLQRLRARLVTLLRSDLTAPERAEAGVALAHLDDPRFRANAWYLPDKPLLGFVEIPAGPFMMGSDRASDAYASEWEERQHEVNLPRYYIARYPVTVAQFQTFIAASGHAWEYAEYPQGPPNHPVVWVTWHDALAYCHWLTERLRAWEHTPEPLATLLRQEGWCITLPSEAEWEKAARGTDGRRYPWGNDPDPDRANYVTTGINTTSTVGCFPKGASPYGVEELSGNVWEWTRSLWGDNFTYPYDPHDGRENLDAPDNVPRVLRGGAFFNDHQFVRCASRYRSVARSFYDGFGFRVAVVGRP